MPLASSLTASQKRAQAVQVEKERMERLQRISLPKTIRSSTRVTRDSVKRRRNSLRAASEERMKKQVKNPAFEKGNNNNNDTASVNKSDNNSTKENQEAVSVAPRLPPAEIPIKQVEMKSPPRKKKAAPDEVCDGLLQSPTPYWKVG